MKGAQGQGLNDDGSSSARVTSGLKTTYGKPFFELIVAFNTGDDDGA